MEHVNEMSLPRLGKHIQANVDCKRCLTVLGMPVDIRSFLVLGKAVVLCAVCRLDACSHVLVVIMIGFDIMFRPLGGVHCMSISRNKVEFPLAGAHGLMILCPPGP